MIKTLIVLLALLISFPAYAVEVIDFPAETTPTSTDVLYLIKAGGGAGMDRQVTVGNISKGLTGSPTFTSVTVSKTSGVAGQIQLYNDYLTETFGAILKGPTGTMASAYTLQFPNAAPTAGQVMLYNAPMTWQTYGQGLGAATATTLTTTGIIDGKIHVESANGKTIDKLRARYVATGTNNFIVPTPTSIGGNDYCFKQANAGTSTIAVVPVASSGVMLEKTDGTAYCTANYKLVSGGANTDKLCLTALDATHYDVFSYTGNWTCTANSTCNVYEENTADKADALDINSWSGNYYRGVQPYSPAAANVSICRIDANMSKTGTITGKTYYAKIWATDGTDLTGSALATSGSVSGAAWSDTWVTFTFSSPYEIHSGTNYVFTINSTDAADGDNYAIWNASSPPGFQGGQSRFTSAGVRSDFGNNDLMIKVYNQ